MEVIQNTNLEERINTYWEKYKSTYALGNINSFKEIYKWRVFKQVFDKWNWSNEDKANMLFYVFDVVGDNNLWASGNYLPILMLKEFLKEFPKEVIEAFEVLFDTNNELLFRILKFRQICDQLLIELQNKYPEREKMKVHYQDIRMVSIYLMLQFPNDFIFYKYTVARELFKNLGIEGIKKGNDESLIKYNELAREIKYIILKDQDYLNKYNSYLSNHDDLYNDPCLNILTQDFMYAIVQYLDEKPKRYWVYAPGEKAIYWDDFFEQGVMAIGWDELEDLEEYSNKEEIKKALILHYEYDTNPYNAGTAIDDFVNNMHIGDVVIVKQGRSKLLGYGEVTSDYYKDDQRIDFGNCRTVNWVKKGEWDIQLSLPLKTLTDITIYDSSIETDKKFYQYLIDIMNGITDNKALPNVKLQPMNMSLNQILYGPPGTGKTYTLQNKFVEHFTKREITITKEEYVKGVIQDLSWWQVITLVLLDIKKGKVKDIHDHPYTKLKEQFSTSKTVMPTIWGQLQAHTLLRCPHVNVEKRQEPLYFWKDESSNWSIIQEDLETAYNEIIDVYEGINNYVPETGKTIKNYEFVTFHQSFTYEDFIEGIKPDLEDNAGGDIKYRIKDGVFKSICKRAAKDPENKYALFIDEINRGNVSAIFGELITLIEESKRLGKEEALQVTLPYSKEKFGVPDNLYIIGTMNTADRSVEALDTALRRRFTFEEMMPNYEVIESENSLGIDLKEVLETINARIEVLLDRDHLIGHSYFLGVDSIGTLIARFKNNIIPLLQEYFYGDYGKIGLVLGGGFVTKTAGMKVSFASFDYDSEMYQDKVTYTLKAIEDEEEFRNAIGHLLGK